MKPHGFGPAPSFLGTFPMRFPVVLLAGFVLNALLLAAPETLRAQEKSARPHESVLDLGFAVTDLPQLASQTAPAQARLIQSLSPPHDEVELTDDGTLWLEPGALFPGSPPMSATLAVREIDKAGKPGQERLLSAASIRTWRSYEELVLAAVKQIRDGQETELERLSVSQKILVAVLRWHHGVRVKPRQAVNPWLPLQEQLANQLQQVRLEYLAALARTAADSADWKAVRTFADQLQRVYPNRKTVQTHIAQALIQYAAAQRKAGAFQKMREALLELEQGAALQDKVAELRQQLQAEAHRLWEQAKRLADKAQAVAGIEEAVRLCPTLPGLRDDLLQRQGNYQVLYVGVPQLPEWLSPGTAVTDTEKRSLDLLFESLLQIRSRKALGQFYQPELAVDLPSQQADELQFSLSGEARWSTGEMVTPADIRQTVELLRDPNYRGRMAIWKDLIDPPHLGGPPLSLHFRLRRDFYDPLFLFTFPIVPQTFQGKALVSLANEAFARSPVGSGPYRYKGRTNDENQACAVFAANPYYARSDRPELPYIREIRLRAATAAAALNVSPPAHLLLDLSAEQAAQVRAHGVHSVQVLPNRRIHFLAINHRKAILQNRELRQAFAAAIDRDSILDECFRGKHPVYKKLDGAGAALGVAGAYLGAAALDAHHSLTGPFPAQSWACAPVSRVPVKIYDAERARSLLSRVKEKVREMSLTLKYPEKEPAIEQACQRLVGQLQAAAAGVPVSLKIQLVPLPPRTLQDALLKHDYDLAYTYWDYSSEYYWLWPLFDPGADALAPGGSNFLGYANDATLVSLLRSRMNQPDFRRLQELSQDVHAHLYERMPFIPLWQLDTILAIHPQLQPTNLDPLRIFSDAAHWKLKT